MKKNRMKIATLLCISAFALVSCSNSSATQDTTARKVIVYEREDDRYRLAVGENNQLTAHSYGTKTDRIAYQSSDESILTVNSTGLVTGVNVGKAYIIMTSQDDDSVVETADYTVCNDFLDSFPAAKTMVDSMKSYDYEKGMHFDADVNFNIGDISMYGISLTGGKTSLIDTDRNGQGITVPFDFDLQKKKTDEDKDDVFAHIGMELSDIVDTIVEENPILNTIMSLTGSLGYDAQSMLYRIIANQIDEDFQDYLEDADYGNFQGIDIYNFGEASYYTALTRNFSTEDSTKDIHPFAFEEGSVLDKFASYDDEILNLVLSYIVPGFQEEDNWKVDVGGVTLDLSKFMTKDGMLYLSEMLTAYVEDKTENGITTYSLNDEVLEKLNDAYQEKVGTSGEYFLDVEDFEFSIEVPVEITDISIKIDNSLQGTAPFNGIDISLTGLNTDKEEYTALSLSMDKPLTYEEYLAKEDDARFTSMDDMRKEYENYKTASEDFRSLDSVSESALGVDINIEKTTNVKQIIKDANTMYVAQKTYGAESSTNLLDMRNKILLYYYSQAITTEERQYLLYPAIRRIEEMTFPEDDYTAMTVSGVNLNDGEKQKAAFNHFVNGKEVKDYTLTYASSDEDIVTIDENGIFEGVSGIYNGSVSRGNVKDVDRSASISVTATPTDDSTMTSSVTKSQTVYYKGDNKKFKKNKTAFKTMANFDESTREMTVSAGSSFTLKDLFDVSSSAVVRGYSKDSKLATANLLTGKVTVNSTYQEGNDTRNLCGIQAVIVSSGVTETIVFYLRIV